MKNELAAQRGEFAGAILVPNSVRTGPARVGCLLRCPRSISRGRKGHESRSLRARLHVVTARRLNRARHAGRPGSWGGDGRRPGLPTRREAAVDALSS